MISICVRDDLFDCSQKRFNTLFIHAMKQYSQLNYLLLQI